MGFQQDYQFRPYIDIVGMKIRNQSTMTDKKKGEDILFSLVHSLNYM